MAKPVSHSGKAADRWSAGVTLYKHYTGKYPFDGSEAQILAQLDYFSKMDDAACTAVLFIARLNVPEHAQKAIRALLVDDPKLRKSPQEALDLLMEGMKGPPNQADREDIINAAKAAKAAKAA